MSNTRHPVGMLFGKVRQRVVVLVPVAPETFLAVGCVVLRKTARPERVVIPTQARLLGPVVGGEGVVLVQKANEAGDGFLARPLQADDAQARFGGQRVLQVRQVERSGVAQDAFAAPRSPAGEAFAQEPRPVVRPPRQQRRLLARNLRAGLAVKDVDHRKQAAAAATHDEKEAVHHAFLGGRGRGVRPSFCSYSPSPCPVPRVSLARNQR